VVLERALLLVAVDRLPLPAALLGFFLTPDSGGSGQRAERVSPISHERRQQTDHDIPDQRVLRGQFQRMPGEYGGEGQAFQGEHGGGDQRQNRHPLRGCRDPKRWEKDFDLISRGAASGHRRAISRRTSTSHREAFLRARLRHRVPVGRPLKRRHHPGAVTGEGSQCS